MKRVSTFLMAMLMIVALAIPAFAASAFVSSPSDRPAPTIVSFEPDHKDCKAELVITAYADRASLSDEARALLEQAYADIANGGSDFLSILAQLAEQLKVDASELAISDLFDIDTTHCADHDEHGGFTITIKIDDASKLVGILHLNQTGWEICDIYDIDREGDTVKFHGTEFSPFALVVTTGELPAEGGSNLWWIILLIVVVLAAVGAALWFFVFKKKDKAAEAAK